MKAREIAELVGGELRGDGDADIDSVSDLSTAGRAQIAFVDKLDLDLATDASCLLVPPGFDPILAGRVEDRTAGATARASRNRDGHPRPS